MEVFHLEQQISIKDEIELEQEKIASTFLIEYKGKQIGTIRYFKLDDETYKIGRFAIMKQYRNKGFGTQVITFLTNYISKRFYPKNIVIYAQIKSKNVYQKAGYIPYGKPFYEAKIRHIKMKYENKK